jgi:hypothetical protein
VVDLHQLDRRPVDFDERDGHTETRTVRLDDDAPALKSGREVVDLERDVREGLDEVRVRRVVPVALPLDPRTGCSGDR